MNWPAGQLSTHVPLVASSAGMIQGDRLHLRQTAGLAASHTSQPPCAHSAQPVMEEEPATATLYLPSGQSRRQLVWPP